jgi:predicted AAA+ superfamily ATPase
MKIETKDLVELDQLARQEGKKYDRKRFLYEDLQQLSGKHFTGIIGPRGAGKTVLLKQLLIEWENSFYVSPLQTNLWVISGTGKLPSV